MKVCTKPLWRHGQQSYDVRLQIRVSAEVIGVQFIVDQPWLLVREDRFVEGQPEIPQRFRIVAGGEEVPESSVYIGSYQNNRGALFHVFKVPLA